jgi:hypothetical protein
MLGHHMEIMLATKFTAEPMQTLDASVLCGDGAISLSYQCEHAAIQARVDQPANLECGLEWKCKQLLLVYGS